MARSLAFDLLYKAGIARHLRHSKRNHLTILSLHRISDDDDFFFNPLTPAAFEELIKYSLDHYTILSFSELADIESPLKKPPLILSFDDGYYDFYENALPLLQKYGLPSNHNVVNECANRGMPIWTHRLNAIFSHCMKNRIELRFDFNGHPIDDKEFSGNWNAFYMAIFRRLLETSKPLRMAMIEEKENRLSFDTEYRMMNWNEIVECSKNRVEIGSHTYSHDVISGIDDTDQLKSEIIDSKIEIEQKVGNEVSILALPNGQGNEFINEFIHQAGFRYLLYVNDGINQLNSADDSLRILDRINIVRESLSEMFLRVEMFHSKVRKYV